ncbi:MAG: DNA translocase FtsK [Muribaculaceae bacterium]|nr:DNA translocase FtsK [Muribaculaceae bacterium]
MMNMLLIQRFGWTGAVIVSLLLVGVIAMIYLNELITLYKISRARMKAVKERREQARLEREKREQAVRENMSDKGVSDETDEQKSAVEEDETITSEEKKVVFDEHDAQEQKEMDDIAEQTDDEPVAEHEPKDDEALLDEMMNVHREKTDDTENVTLADESSEAMDDVTATDDEPAVKNEPGADKIDDEVPLEIIHNEIEQAESINNPFDPTAELSHYQFPPLDLLIDHPTDTTRNTVQEEDKERIIRSLREYGINITKIDATVGPTVTLFEIVPEEGTRIQQIKRLEDDLMRSLSAIGIRIVAPIPGKGTIGIEVPNKNPQTVGIRAVLSSKKYQEFKGELPMAMGATISNEVYVADLAKMPHLLVAGATGQGKSVGLNTIIASLIYRKHPSTLKFVLIDPKMVEFSLYSKLEHHYLAKMPDEDEPIITQTDRVISTLNSLCVEMENRYRQLKSAGVRNIKEYNDKFTARQLNPEKGHQFLPYIVVIIDEFADLISVLGKEVETPVARITAKARAVGIHMIIATQRPSIDVITGVIKNNIPGRIAFKVPQSIDSKTILDRTGANQLIGRGDMLFLNGSNLERVQCAFIDTPEVEAICNFIENETGFPTPYLLPDYNPNGANEGNAGAVTERDPLFAECARFIIQSGTASTSSLQRRYGIGYNRAGKIMDQMEAAGIVGPAMGSKPRQVLLDIIALERLLEDMGI